MEEYISVMLSHLVRHSFPKQVDKSRVPEEEKGSGILKEEERTTFLFFFFPSTFFNLSHIECFFFFFKPRTDDYTTKQLSLGPG